MCVLSNLYMDLFIMVDKQHMAYMLEKFSDCAECILITSNKPVCVTLALQATVQLLFQLNFFLNIVWFMLFVSGSGL